MKSIRDLDMMREDYVSCTESCTKAWIWIERAVIVRQSGGSYSLGSIAAQAGDKSYSRQQYDSRSCSYDGKDVMFRN
jgi:hypothetical protein